ncbi:MAG TPA: hypothetical protein PKC67_03390 [Kiritimatiellia bacterium]|nr:hypothetical protein [Kiritimatiellia bacterium]HMP33371.1 hypothetical protein [Kiritimatiellia bacterium]
MSTKSTNLEKFGLVALLGLIGFGFLAMVVALVRAPAPPSVLDEQDRSVAPAERSRESLRTYNAPLTVHSFRFGVDPEDDPVDVDRHRHLVPDAPEAAWSSTGDAMPARRPMPSVRKPLTPEEEDLLDTRPGSSLPSWGWLADEVNNRRDGFPSTGQRRANDASSPGKRGMDNAARDARKAADADDEEDMDPMQAGRTERRGALERSSEWEQSDATGPLLRPVRDLERERDDRKARNDPRSADARDRSSARNDDEENESGQREEEQTSSTAGLVMRDPFAPNEERPAPFGSGSWTMERGDVFAGGRGLRERDVTLPTRDEAAGRLSGIRGGFEEPGGRLVGDAATDASRLSAGWSGYASDSVFIGGGGYTPQGVRAIGSEPLFSGSSALGGSFSPARSDFSSGAIAPIGGSGSMLTPSSGSSALTPSRSTGERANPSALPW